MHLKKFFFTNYNSLILKINGKIKKEKGGNSSQNSAPSPAHGR